MEFMMWIVAMIAIGGFTVAGIVLYLDECSKTEELMASIEENKKAIRKGEAILKENKELNRKIRRIV